MMPWNIVRRGVVPDVMDFLETLVRYETDLWNHLDDRLRAAASPSLSTVFALRVVARHAGECRVHELHYQTKARADGLHKNFGCCNFANRKDTKA